MLASFPFCVLNIHHFISSCGHVHWDCLCKCNHFSYATLYLSTCAFVYMCGFSGEMFVSLSCSVVSVAEGNPLFNLASELKTCCPPVCRRPPTVKGIKSNRIPLKGCLCRALSNRPDAVLRMTIYSLLLQGRVDEKTNVLQC